MQRKPINRNKWASFPTQQQQSFPIDQPAWISIITRAHVWCFTYLVGITGRVLLFQILSWIKYGLGTIGCKTKCRKTNSSKTKNRRTKPRKDQKSKGNRSKSRKVYTLLEFFMLRFRPSVQYCFPLRASVLSVCCLSTFCPFDVLSSTNIRERTSPSVGEPFSFGVGYWYYSYCKCFDGHAILTAHNKFFGRVRPPFLSPASAAIRWHFFVAFMSFMWQIRFNWQVSRQVRCSVGL